MNPLATHWLRVSVLLLVAMPVVAFAVAAESDITFTLAIIFTLYMWAGVCVILAVVALLGLMARLLGRGIRGLRR